MQKVPNRSKFASASVADKVKLGMVCDLNMGQSPDSASYNVVGEGLPFYQGNADFGDLYPTPRVWCNAPTRIARSGDVLISVRAPIGALNFANEDSCIGRGLAALRMRNDGSQRYLYYFLKSKTCELNMRGTGSTFKAINKSALADIELSLPLPSVQREIAAKLDKISDLMVKRREQLTKLDQLVKSRFVEAA